MNATIEKFRISRRFNASKDKVFNALAQAEALAQWWGPINHPITVLVFDFKPEGKFHYHMQDLGWGLFVYKKINPHNTIEFVSSFADAEGHVYKAPFAIDFPLEIYNILTLEDTDGVTTLTLEGSPMNATTEQVAVFHSLNDSMLEGYGATFDQLTAYLQNS